MDNHLDVFWIGNDGSVQTNWWNERVNAGSWNTPYRIPNSSTAPPGASVAAVARKPDQLDVFWVRNDGAVETNWWNANGGWRSSFSIPNSSTAPPGASVAAVARKPDQLDVFWVRNDGAVETNWWNANQGWGTSFPITDPNTAPPR